MGFEENREDDYWHERGGPSHSKGNFLKAAAQCGAVQTGFTKDGECPYYGATAHAEELAHDGLVEKMLIESLHGGEPFTCWIITTLGKIMAGMTR